MPRGKNIWEFNDDDILTNLITSDATTLIKNVRGELNKCHYTISNFLNTHFNHPISVPITVLLTRYGPGGSYNPDDMNITVDVFRLLQYLQKHNGNRHDIKGLPPNTLGGINPWVIIHELIHLQIHDAVVAAGLNTSENHWKKEWLVDEIMMSNEIQAMIPGNWRQSQSVPPDGGIKAIDCWKKLPTW